MIAQKCPQSELPVVGLGRAGGVSGVALASRTAACDPGTTWAASTDAVSTALFGGQCTQRMHSGLPLLGALHASWLATLWVFDWKHDLLAAPVTAFARASALA